MARRPKPPEWLTRQFWEVTVFKAVGGREVDAGCYFSGVVGDPRPCEGRTQACHFLSRQQIRNGLWALGAEPELIVLAEWDPRNGVPGCEHEHHARFDNRRLPPLKVKIPRVPGRVVEFVKDWGLEPQLERRVGP